MDIDNRVIWLGIGTEEKKKEPIIYSAIDGGIF